MNLNEVDLLLQDWTSLALDDEHDRKLLALALTERFGTKPFVRYQCILTGQSGVWSREFKTLRDALAWCQTEAKTAGAVIAALVGFGKDDWESEELLLEWQL